jgi:hypothetical protein
MMFNSAGFYKVGAPREPGWRRVSDIDKDFILLLAIEEEWESIFEKAGV